MAKAKAAAKQSKKALAKAKAKALAKGSRTEEGAVHRVLVKEFRGWSMQALATKASDGKTALQVVKEALSGARAARLLKKDF